MQKLKIYQKYHIPAITGQSGNVSVTLDNEWYFRTIFNDHLQGRFIANYAKKVSKQNALTIIHEDLPYGKNLSEIVAQASREIDLPVKYKWDYVVEDANLKQRLTQIVEETKAEPKLHSVLYNHNLQYVVTRVLQFRINIRPLRGRY